MIIKSFTAESASAALKTVRKEMGGNAIVLKTRQLTDRLGGPRVEITACLENPTVGQASVLSTPDASQTGRPALLEDSVRSAPPMEPADTGSTEAGIYQRLDELDRKFDRLVSTERPFASGVGTPEAVRIICDRLYDADLPEEFVSSVLGPALSQGGAEDNIEDRVRSTLVEHLSSLMTPAVSFQPGDRVAFIGPAGSGKSSVMGKLAARLVIQEKRKVSLVSLDDRKLGAYDELCGYAEVLGATVAEPVDSGGKVEPVSDAIQLIDTPGLAADEEGRRELAGRLDQSDPGYRFAVFSSLMRSSDALAMATLMEPLAPTHIAMTMLDLTDRIGSALAVAGATGWKIALVSDSPGGIGDLKTPDPDRVARTLLRMEVGLE